MTCPPNDQLDDTITNTDQIDAWPVCDQREVLTIGDEAWRITGDDGQTDYMIRLHRPTSEPLGNDGAVTFGGDSLWGNWVEHGGRQVLMLDNGYNDDGEQIYVTESGDEITSDGADA